MKSKFLLACVLFSSTLGIFSCTSSNKSEQPVAETPSAILPHNDSIDPANIPTSDLLQPINQMINEMKDTKISEDFDLNFVNMMMLHHQCAIDMAQIQISNGKDEKIITLAKSIIEKRNEEIKILKDHGVHHKPKGINEIQADNALTAAMQSMKEKVDNLKLTGNTDKDFAQMMMLHQDCTIEMAAEEIIQGHHVRIKLLAKSMISDQNKELATIKSWLASH